MPKKLLLVSFIIFLTALPTITSAQTQCKEASITAAFTLASRMHNPTASA